MASTVTVTILFTDMVGSTELSSRLDANAADELRQGHFSVLRQALAASEGREVKNTGDGLMAVFTSPSAALNCAVGMQQGVELDNRRSARQLGLRVGVSGGEVTTEDDDYFGDPVIEAARLCAACDGGQVLASEIARIMAGRRSPHRFRALGERTLKGMAEPVSVCEVEWEPLPVAAGTPLPDRLQPISSAGLFGFFGRQPEQERLLAAVSAVVDGGRRVAFISGEPGIGKTSLCRVVAQEAHDRGVTVLYGRSDEDLGVSYQPLAEALNQLVIHADEALLARHVAENGGALASLVPALSKRMPGLTEVRTADPDTERFRLFGAVVGLLSLVSSEESLLLVLDDLHWADRATLQLTRHLACSDQLSKVMILGTYRDSDLAAGSPLADMLASLRREVAVERIDLAGLDDTEVVEMMEKVAGHEMNEAGVDLAHAVRRETEGNPFFTTEMLRHLGEAGLVFQDATGRWVANEDLYERGLPQSVREVVGQRVDRLGEEARRVLSLAAVIGRDFDVGLLARVAAIDEDGLLDLIDEATEAGLVVEVEGVIDRFGFAHALTQHTLYEDLGATRRSRAHRKTAEVLEGLCGDTPEQRAGELARHFVAATRTVDTTKAISYSRMAGAQALAQHAPADALGWFMQALDLSTQAPLDQAVLCDLLIGLGTAQRQSGLPAHRETLLRAAAVAESLGNSELLVAAALANSRSGASAAGLVDRERVEVLERALEMSGDVESVERALLLVTLANELTYADQPDRRARLIDDALQTARRSDDPFVRLAVISRAYQDEFLPDNLETRLSDLAEAVAIASTVGDPVARFRAHYNRAVACVQAGDRAGFDVHIDGCKEMVDQLGPYERWTVVLLQSMRSLLSGDLPAAESQADAALAVAAESAPEALAAYGAQLSEIRYAQGRLDEIVEFFAQAAIDNPGLPVIRAAIARNLCELERDDEALAMIEDDIDDGFVSYPYNGTWLPAMACLAEACSGAGRVDGAQRLYDLLVPWHSQVVCVGPTTQGPVALYLAMLSTFLGHYDDAERHFAESLELSLGLQAPYWSARTRFEWAKMARLGGRDGDEGHAAEMLTSALAAARTHGFKVLEERVAALS